jgi:hypothetical protein
MRDLTLPLAGGAKIEHLHGELPSGQAEQVDPAYESSQLTELGGLHLAR